MQRNNGNEANRLGNGSVDGLCVMSPLNLLVFQGRMPLVNGWQITPIFVTILSRLAVSVMSHFNYRTLARHL